MKSSLMLAATIALWLSWTGPVQALEIKEFDKLGDAEQDDYVGGMLQAAERLLTQAGQPDLAAKVNALFTEPEPGEDIPPGVVEFAANMAGARAADRERAKTTPSEPPIEVEEAMMATLEDRGIKLPDSFLTAMKDYKPAPSQSPFSFPAP